MLRRTAFLVLALAAPSGWAGPDDDVEAPQIFHEEVQAAVAGRDLVITATIEDPSGVFDPTVLYRVGGEGSFLRAPMSPAEEEGRYEATVPGELVVADIEYFIEAFDELGNGPARYGEEDLPVAVPVVAPGAALSSGEGSGDGATGGAAGSGAGASPGEASGSDSPGDGVTTPPASEAEDEGGSLGLWLGLGGAGAGAVVVVGAVAAAGAAVAYVYFTSQDGDAPPGEVTVSVDAPGPAVGALTGAP